jgi:hypothetical protein
MRDTSSPLARADAEARCFERRGTKGGRDGVPNGIRGSGLSARRLERAKRPRVGSIARFDRWKRPPLRAGSTRSPIELPAPEGAPRSRGSILDANCLVYKSVFARNYPPPALGPLPAAELPKGRSRTAIALYTSRFSRAKCPPPAPRPHVSRGHHTSRTEPNRCKSGSH